MIKEPMQQWKDASMEPLAKVSKSQLQEKLPSWNSSLT
jgi:hypothetical protein